MRPVYESMNIKVKQNVNRHTQNGVKMKSQRRLKLAELLNKRYGGDRARLMAEAQISKARLSQLLSENFVFGERAARALEEKLNLPTMYFDRPDTDPAAWPADVINAASILATMSESQRRRAWSVIVALHHADDSDDAGSQPMSGTLN